MEAIIKLKNTEKDGARILQIEKNGADKILLTMTDEEDSGDSFWGWTCIDISELLKALDFLLQQR